MYVEVVPNRDSPPAVLLREGWREGKKIRKRTVANLSDWPEEKIETLRRVLRGETLVPPEEAFHTERSLPHGHVEVILAMARKLRLDALISPRPCRERDLVMAMVVERLIHPCSKLATTRLWHETTLAQELHVEDADVNELYDAMDWLLARKERIERKLADRHLREGGLVLYDVSSSYYEGHTCPLARFGHDRDGKGMPCIIYGLMTDAEGRPVAVQTYPGGTGDSTTVPDQVDKLRHRFGLSRVVLVGDRGMLTETQIDKLRAYPGLGWISALRSEAIRELLENQYVNMSLFDVQNIAEISTPEYAGERLVVCFNPLLQEERRRKRHDLLQATEKALDKIVKEVARRTRNPLDKAEIGLKVGRVINRHKMRKHFKITIEDGLFRWERVEASVRQEEAQDGIYVIRTSEPEEALPTDDCVRSYKGLARVERGFRTLKGIELRVRPIRHRTKDRVPTHVFICTLAYYVEWHLRDAMKSVLFDDEELEENRKTRDPVAPAEASPSAKTKKVKRVTADGLPVESFETLIIALGTRCRNRCRIASEPGGPTFEQVTDPTPLQARVLDLLKAYPCS